jgi:hypothetical protein
VPKEKEAAMGDTSKKDKDKHRKQQVDKQAQEAKRKLEQTRKRIP